MGPCERAAGGDCPGLEHTGLAGGCPPLGAELNTRAEHRRHWRCPQCGPSWVAWRAAPLEPCPLGCPGTDAEGGAWRQQP